jgi:hypothetical protein
MTPPEIASEWRPGPAIAAVQDARTARLSALSQALIAVRDHDRATLDEHQRKTLNDAQALVDELRGPRPGMTVLNAGAVSGD